MPNILSALIPIFSLILLGYFFKKIKFPAYEFWPLADKLTYNVLMPALLISKLKDANLNAKESFYYILSALLMIFIVLLVMLVLNKILKFNPKSFTSIVQGGIRFNTYVFLALSASFFSSKGLVLAAILLTFVIPFNNIICISTFAIFVNEDRFSFIYLFKMIFKNPLIIACIIGGTLAFFQINLPVSINKIIFTLSQAALPMGLMSVGFGLVIKEMKAKKLEIFVSCFAKLFLSLIVIYLLGRYFSLDKTMLSLLIIFASLPTAPSSFVLARQERGDVPLMSSIITLETILSFFVLSFVLSF